MERKDGGHFLRVSDVQFDEADRYSRKIDVPASVHDAWNKQMFKVRVLTGSSTTWTTT